MRASRLGRGGAAAATLVASRPRAGVERMVEVVSSLFRGPETVSFAPVDGVFEAELSPEHHGPQALARQRRVVAARADAPIRLYNARAREIYVHAPRLGGRVDLRG